MTTGKFCDIHDKEMNLTRGETFRLRISAYDKKYKKSRHIFFDVCLKCAERALFSVAKTHELEPQTMWVYETLRQDGVKADGSKKWKKEYIRPEEMDDWNSKYGRSAVQQTPEEEEADITTPVKEMIRPKSV